MTSVPGREAPPLRVTSLTTKIGSQVIHENLDLTLEMGEILGLVGGSGAGKSVLLKTMLGLLPPAAGTVEVFGTDVYSAGEARLVEISHRRGVLFQGNALFADLNVVENIAAPLREVAHLPPQLCEEVAYLKMLMSGLPPDAAIKLPAELSGGMQKRAGLARAIVHDPELLLLDEPTSGLDPIMADQIDALIKSLAELLDLTVLVITHDLDTLYGICDRVAVLVDRQIAAVAPVRELERSSHPWIRDYLLGPRKRGSGRAGQG
jgi:phospholipid/cholesterol/gamma-HCH transport system ATP-binding protein